MPPTLPNFKDGQDQKDSILETSRKCLAQEMLMCNMKEFGYLMTNANKKKTSKDYVRTDPPYHKDIHVKYENCSTHY